MERVNTKWVERREVWHLSYARAQGCYVELDLDKLIAEQEQSRLETPLAAPIAATSIAWSPFIDAFRRVAPSTYRARAFILHGCLQLRLSGYGHNVDVMITPAEIRQRLRQDPDYFSGLEPGTPHTRYEIFMADQLREHLADESYAYGNLDLASDEPIVSETNTYVGILRKDDRVRHKDLGIELRIRELVDPNVALCLTDDGHECPFGLEELEPLAPPQPPVMDSNPEQKTQKQLQQQIEEASERILRHFANYMPKVLLP